MRGDQTFGYPAFLTPFKIFFRNRANYYFCHHEQVEHIPYKTFFVGELYSYISAVAFTENLKRAIYIYV